MKKSETLLISRSNQTRAEQIQNELVKLTIADLDYSTLTACLVKSNLLQLALVQPH